MIAILLKYNRLISKDIEQWACIDTENGRFPALFADFPTAIAFWEQRLKIKKTDPNWLGEAFPVWESYRLVEWNGEPLTFSDFGKKEDQTEETKGVNKDK